METKGLMIFLALNFAVFLGLLWCILERLGHIHDALKDIAAKLEGG